MSRRHIPDPIIATIERGRATSSTGRQPHAVRVRRVSGGGTLRRFGQHVPSEPEARVRRVSADSPLLDGPSPSGSLMLAAGGRLLTGTALGGVPTQRVFRARSLVL